MPLNNPDSKRFSMIGIAVQHFPGARSIVLLYSQMLQAHRDFIPTAVAK